MVRKIVMSKRGLTVHLLPFIGVIYSPDRQLFLYGNSHTFLVGEFESGLCVVRAIGLSLGESSSVIMIFISFNIMTRSHFP